MKLNINSSAPLNLSSIFFFLNFENKKEKNPLALSIEHIGDLKIIKHWESAGKVMFPLRLHPLQNLIFTFAVNYGHHKENVMYANILEARKLA